MIILYITLSLRVNYQHGTPVAMITRCPLHFTQSPTSWARLLLSPPSCVDNLLTCLRLPTIKGYYHPPPHFTWTLIYHARQPTVLHTPMQMPTLQTLLSDFSIGLFRKNEKKVGRL